MVYQLGRNAMRKKGGGEDKTSDIGLGKEKMQS